jgi:hypothetical protein
LYFSQLYQNCGQVYILSAMLCFELHLFCDKWQTSVLSSMLQWMCNIPKFVRSLFFSNLDASGHDLCTCMFFGCWRWRCLNLRLGDLSIASRNLVFFIRGSNLNISWCFYGVLQCNLGFWYPFNPLLQLSWQECLFWRFLQVLDLSPDGHAVSWQSSNHPVI